MNRRHLLQAMLSVPVLGAIGGCRRDDRSAPARGGTLKVILQGPFALVLDTREHYRIKAFVPFDEDNLHEFRFRDPHDPPISGEGDPARRNRYQFTLLDHNLEISAKPRHIDSGFDDVTLHVNGWQPSPNDYFVALDLPAPDLISYIPPAIPVVMAGAGAPRLAMMPTNHVLEYRVRDLDDIGKITLRSPQLGDRQPVSCADLLGGFREHWHATEKAHPNRQRGSMETDLGGCSDNPVRAFFLGVGIPPTTTDYDKKAPAHALAFFNNKILGAFPGAREKDNKRLLQVDARPCLTGDGSGGRAALVSAVESYPSPWLMPVSSADDCRAGGVHVITG